jgi:branched-chain amino acid transport system ATP-binding protein
VGLGWAADRPAGDLPLGLGRSLELARALCIGPRVLLLDEPSSGLNPSETDALGDVLRDITRDLGLATILVEHDIGLVARVCEHVFVMDAGAVIAEGSPKEVRENPGVVAAYLGTSA